MIKFFISFILTGILIGCGTGSNVSEVRVPPSKTETNKKTETQIDSSEINSGLENISDSTEISDESEILEKDSSQVVVTETETKDPVTINKNEALSKELTNTDVVKKTEVVKTTAAIKSPSSINPKPVSNKKSFNFRNFNKDAHRTGEKLTFNINYLAITAGEATMAVTEEFNYNNRLVQKILFEANSSRSYSWIYKVEDKYVSYLDKFGIYPWKFSKEINEGSFHTKEEVIFDHIKEEAREGEKITKIPPYTHDIISAFYFVRNNDLSNMRPGDIIKLSNYSSGKIHPLDVRFKGWQQIKVPAGIFNCVVLEPLVKAGGLFKDEGTLVIWLTNDELKIPVKVETKVVIGSINVELKKIEGVNRPIPAKVN